MISRASDFVSQSFGTVDLQRVNVACQMCVDPDAFLSTATSEQYRDAVNDRLRLTLRAYVWGEQPKRIQVRYPRTWWDAFKERWFPQWALDAYPPDYTVKALEAQTIYPALPQSQPGHVYRIRMAVLDLSHRNGGPSSCHA